MNYINPLEQLSVNMYQECGGKAANLGELARLGFNVPEGFCVLSNAYFHFIEKNNIADEIYAIADTIDFKNFSDIKNKCSIIRDIILQGSIPDNIQREINNAYNALPTNDNKEPLVAVRSSVAVRDSDISSFPGMMDTYHYIFGINKVLEMLRECWASLWTDRAASARYIKNIDNTKAIIAPIIQVMIDPDIAGVMFTVNPINSSHREIYIESNWGLGEIVVSGESENDVYSLDKMTLSTKEVKIGKKEFMIVHDKETGIGRKKIPCTEEKIQAQTLTESMLKELGIIGVSIENHYKLPQDIEWAFLKNQLYILQTRVAKTI